MGLFRVSIIALLSSASALSVAAEKGSHQQLDKSVSGRAVDASPAAKKPQIDEPVENQVQELRELAQDIRQTLSAYGERAHKYENQTVTGEGHFSGFLGLSSGSWKIEGRGDEILQSRIYRVLVASKEFEDLAKGGSTVQAKLAKAAKAYKDGSLEPVAGMKAPVSYNKVQGDEKMITNGYFSPKPGTYNVAKPVFDVVEKIAGQKHMEPAAYEALKSKIERLTTLLNNLSAKNLTEAQSKNVEPIQTWADDTVLIVTQANIRRPFKFGYQVANDTKGVWNRVKTMETEFAVIVDGQFKPKGHPFPAAVKAGDNTLITGDRPQEADKLLEELISVEESQLPIYQ